MTTCGDLPPALWLERDVRVVVCAEHGSAYTQANLDRHLVEAHHVKPAGRRRIHEYLRQEGGIARYSVGERPPRRCGTHHRPGGARRLRLHVYREWLVCACACKRCGGCSCYGHCRRAYALPISHSERGRDQAARPARPRAWASRSYAAAAAAATTTTTSVALAFAASICICKS